MEFNAADLLHSFETRVYGYMAFLTDDYPPVGLERSRAARRAAGAARRTEPPAAPAV